MKPEAADPRLAKLFHSRERLLLPDVGISDGALVHDGDLVRRIVASYRKAQAYAEDTHSFWSNHFSGLKADVHERLMIGTEAEVAEMLRRPDTHNLFYGFDNPCAAFPYAGLSEIDDRFARLQIYDILFRLAESVGAVRLDYPEGDAAHQRPLRAVDELVGLIEDKTGVELLFPNPFPDEVGAASFRGVIGYRTVQAVAQALILRSHCDGNTAPKVLEIGAGLGRTAYNALRFIGGDYTIVDLPLTNVAQAYFLGRTLGEQRVVLFEEPERAGVRILPSHQFFDEASRFDLALNVDSLTEMSEETAVRYLDAVQDRAELFISINHEFNAFTVEELFSRRSWRAQRSPYWVRAGYVQEVVRFSRPPSPLGRKELLGEGGDDRIGARQGRRPARRSGQGV